MKILLAILALALPALAGTATIAWDANPPAEAIKGYKVYYGTATGSYTQIVDVGVTTQIVLDLGPGEYFLNVTAYNASGLEGTFSEELAFTVPASPPTPVKGIRVVEIQTSSNLVDWEPLAWIPVGEPPFYLRAVAKEIQQP